ncbi:HIT family protein [Peloplasma aerotolerans]|jgi:histidine triad (HIT) family protein|uniref:HIT family protein n=1 Tax=Peloplasma aerotolerans TaxID=3044389 RepID=A0AAW6U2U8_9MOLU|nr:HIT family protein [Mariniplasma sp. M4Ah]MDI6452220.1 HIT family protein [Mariniplasma sp. M4Ah]MDR4968708.1 HIT family protein [Acholeplasmataceae bacterium]
MPSIFSKIIAKEIPAHFVYEDDRVVAFLDISQATKGHTLVVTKEEYTDILGMPEELSAHLFKVVTILSKAITKAFNPQGVNILSNNGETAGQTVFHFHMHIIPRYEKSDVTFLLKNNMGSLSTDDYRERAKLIKAALS